MFRKDIVLGGVCAGMFVMPQLMTARQLVTDGGDKPNIIFMGQRISPVGKLSFKRIA